MKIAGILLASLLVLVLAFLWITAPSAEQREKAAEAARSLRNAVLSREFFKDSSSKPSAGVRAVVYDWQVGSGTATLVAFEDGTTSLYLIPGGGIIGAGSHESVRRAAELFRLEADRMSKSFTPISDYPMPTDGQSIFYLVTDSTTLGSGSIKTVDLTFGKHALSELGRLAQEVVTQIRKAS